MASNSLSLPDYSQPTVASPPSPVGLSEQQASKLESEILAWTDKLFETATQDRGYEKQTRETFRIIDYLEGRQWGGNARRSRNRPVVNKVRRHFFDTVGLLTDLALDF